MLCLLALGVAAPAQEVGPIKVFRGPEGEEVTVLRYGPLQDHKVLVRIAGVDHEWNNKVFLETRDEQDPRRVDVWLNANGGRFVNLVGRENYGRMEYTLYLKNSGRDIPLHFDEESTEKANAQSLLEAYQSAPGQP